MSVETIALAIAAVMMLLAIASAAGWIIRRVDAQFAHAEQRTDARFARIDAQFAHAEERTEARFARVDAQFAHAEKRTEARFAQAEERTDAQFAQVDARFTQIAQRLGGVEHELVEVKIAVARIEGPPRHLLATR